MIKKRFKCKPIYNHKEQRKVVVEEEEKHKEKNQIKIVQQKKERVRKMTAQKFVNSVVNLTKNL